MGIALGALFGATIMGTIMGTTEKTETTETKREEEDNKVYFFHSLCSNPRPQTNSVISMINKTFEPRNPSMSILYGKRIQHYLAGILFDQQIPTDVLYLVAKYLLPDFRIAGFSEARDELIIFNTDTMSIVQKISALPPSWRSDSATLTFCHMEALSISDLNMPLLPICILHRDSVINRHQVDIYVVSASYDVILATKLQLSNKKRALETVNILLHPLGFMTINKLLFLYCDLHRELSIWSLAGRESACLYTITDGYAFNFWLDQKNGLLYLPSSTNGSSTAVYDVSGLLNNSPAPPRYLYSVPYATWIYILQNGKIILKTDNIPFAQLSDQSIVYRSSEQKDETTLHLCHCPKNAKTFSVGTDYRVPIRLPDRTQFTALPGNRILIRIGVIDFVTCKLYRFPKSLFKKFISFSFESRAATSMSFVEQFP